MTKILEIKVTVIHSPMDEAIGSESTLRSQPGAATKAGLDVCELISKVVPYENKCSLIIAHKEIG